MKRFSHLKLTKGLIVLFTLGVSLILYSAFPDYYSTLQVQAQLQQQQQRSPMIGIKITSPSTGQQVPVGELTISGISTDNATSDCTVYADWNNTKPFQTATATGSGGINDYSRWTFTYTDKYHLITNGTNNLTSKLSCVNDSNVGFANLTKFYSVNIIGVTTMNNTANTTSNFEEVQQQESPTIDNNITTIMENITAATATSPISNLSVPATSSVPLSPSIEEQEEEDKDIDDDEEEEPQPTPEPEPELEEDEDTTIYYDIEDDLEEDIDDEDEDNEQISDFEDSMFG
jgi:hypothetical protein